MRASHCGKKCSSLLKEQMNLDLTSKEGLLLLISVSCCLNSSASEMIRICCYANYQSLFTQLLKTDSFSGMARWLMLIVRFFMHVSLVVHISIL